MSSPLDRVLHPGEEVRFEAHARGLPLLSLRTGLLYAAILAFAAILEILGDTVRWTVGTVTLHVPLLAPAIALVAVLELYRTAWFRSRLYAVTNERVVMLSGILRTKLRWDLPASSVREVGLVAGVPVLVTDHRKEALGGLDSVDLESISVALGTAGVLAAVEAHPLRRRAKAILFVLASLFVGVAELDAMLQRSARAEFQRVAQVVDSSFQTAVQQTRADLEAQGFETGVMWSSGLRSQALEGTAEARVQVTAHRRTEAESVFFVGYDCGWSSSIIPPRPSVSLRTTLPGPFGAAFLERLRKMLADAGVSVSIVSGSRD